MSFEFAKTKLPGVVIIQPQVFGDSRGYFMETFKKADYAAAGIDKEFIQDNESSRVVSESRHKIKKLQE